MKKFLKITFILAFLIALASPCFGESSAIQTGSAACFYTGGRFLGIYAVLDGSNTVTFDFYDNNSAGSGNKIIPSFTTTATDKIFVLGYEYNDNVRFTNGVYVTITTAGTVTYQVYKGP